MTSEGRELRREKGDVMVGTYHISALHRIRMLLARTEKDFSQVHARWWTAYQVRALHVRSVERDAFLGLL